MKISVKTNHERRKLVLSLLEEFGEMSFREIYNQFKKRGIKLEEYQVHSTVSGMYKTRAIHRTDGRPKKYHVLEFFNSFNVIPPLPNKVYREEKNETI